MPQKKPERVTLYRVTAGSVVVRRRSSMSTPDRKPMWDESPVYRGTILPPDVAPEEVARLVELGLVQPVTVTV